MRGRLPLPLFAMLVSCGGSRWGTGGVGYSLLGARLEIFSRDGAIAAYREFLFGVSPWSVFAATIILSALLIKL